ncbi:uncharacterized protein [Anabrus simplex]|uniref:uncharacterized protein n=1 Tax=Anabrus simplex TaxID=316456 RepID=UPI0034DDA1A6
MQNDSGFLDAVTNEKDPERKMEVLCLSFQTYFLISLYPSCDLSSHLLTHIYHAHITADIWRIATSEFLGRRLCGQRVQRLHGRTDVLHV